MSYAICFIVNHFRLAIQLRAVIFAIAQLSCYKLQPIRNILTFSHSRPAIESRD